MTDVLTDRLNEVLPKITSDDFLSGKGIGNEIAFYIFDYPPDAELRIREHVQFLLEHIPKKKPGLRVKHVNLFDMVIDHLKDRKLLDRSFQMQQEKGDNAFFKHHLSMYKKRPIYGLFSSGKQRAFECLVYLHRYNEGTLGRMRTEYVIPLQGKINARVDQLADDIEAVTSTSHRNRLQKERDKLIKQQAELRTFDEKLRHYADQRITLDLDDGVKVNYGKFGDLLAEVKAVTGKKPE